MGAPLLINPVSVYVFSLSSYYSFQFYKVALEIGLEGRRGQKAKGQIKASHAREVTYLMPENFPPSLQLFDETYSAAALLS